MTHKLEIASRLLSLTCHFYLGEDERCLEGSKKILILCYKSQLGNTKRKKVNNASIC